MYTYQLLMLYKISLREGVDYLCLLFPSCLQQWWPQTCW